MHRAGTETGAFVLAFALSLGGCRWLNDDGSQFASETADFADRFRRSNQTTAVFEYTPIHGNDQRLYVGIGRIRYCPKTPCYGEGAAMVDVQKGQSGTGYRLMGSVNVPKPLQLQKASGPIRVLMRKNAGGEVDIVGLE